jgi:hypothetical protein
MLALTANSLAVVLAAEGTNSVAQEPEGSSPHSQHPATGPGHEPVEVNPHPPSQSPQDPF